MIRFVGLFLLASTSVVLAQECPSPPAENAAQPAVTFNGQTITLGEIDAQIAEQLCKANLDYQRARYAAREEAINELVTDRLIEAELKARKLADIEALTKALTKDIKAPTEAEAKAFFDREAPPDAPGFETVKGEVISYLHDQRRREAISGFMRSLRAKANVKIALPVMRVKIAGTGPSKGPADAPVTIVEFADYECPYCAKGAATVEQVRQRYPNKVRVVFRDFPLDFHKNAIPAAVAARCAGAQGKYWEMHDVLFENVSNLGADALRGFAKGLGLDLKKYDACVVDPAHVAAVKADQAAGAAAGVEGTPAYFVNGVNLSGAQPEEAFIDLVEKALAEQSK